MARVCSMVGGALQLCSRFTMSVFSYAWSLVHAAFLGNEFLMLTFGEENLS